MGRHQPRGGPQREPRRLMTAATLPSPLTCICRGPLVRGALFYTFETMEEKMRAMANLPQCVLPPQLLLKWPKEASFCQLLMHPVPDT
ncbi:hypothetical protein OsJ_36489 [Oryza sativa Japonica Group]|uniref:Uncharacterized protein n=1 Tax=Oryza sativa subsp. japonica TaxID=39947 RepID=B9GDQ7_ORYSJ|nr:hypothetical protein OsJ_36489 [Oryza sativa Japonica Group]